MLVLSAISKVNGTTIYSLFIKEKDGLGEGPSSYRVTTVRVRKGKISVDRKWSTTNVLPHGLMRAPEFLVENKDVAAVVSATAEVLQNQLLKVAEKAIEKDTETDILLSEKGIEWTVRAKLSECWLEWALGKGWYSIPLQLPPKWAEALRGLWDPAWA